MTDRQFFDGKDWIGKKVDFPDADPPSSWIVVEKLGDKNDQRNAFKYHENPRTSAAYGTFVCRNFADRNKFAVIKIFQQRV